LALLAAAAVAASGGWTLQKSPNPSGATYSTLWSLSCASQTACTAVGQFQKNAGGYRTLAERWTGTKWSLEHTVNPAGASAASLGGVSCASVGECAAVGSYQSGASNLALVERWNGTKWSIQDAPSPAGSTAAYLSAVSCPSARDCMAVGDYESGGTSLALGERWNGKKWSIEHPRNPSGATAVYLSGVSCASAHACTAVGEYQGGTVYRTLAERWNGTKWSIETTPNPAGAIFSALSGVSCTSAGACSAVGSYEKKPNASQTLAEHWNGKKWSVEHTVNPTADPNKYLVSVSCTSARACTAAGYTAGAVAWNATLVEHWNGQKWSVEKSPRPGTDSELNGLSCSAGTKCTAVGWYRHGSGPRKTLVERR
jgi:hypothetical protein